MKYVIITESPVTVDIEKVSYLEIDGKVVKYRKGTMDDLPPPPKQLPYFRELAFEGPPGPENPKLRADYVAALTWEKHEFYQRAAIGYNMYLVVNDNYGFIECEESDGDSIRAGTWYERDGQWLLRINHA